MHIKRINEMFCSLPDLPDIEEFFDISKLTKAKIKYMTTDLRIFFQFPYFDTKPFHIDGVNIVEKVERTLGIAELQRELKQMGFASWQVTAKVMCNRNMVAVLYADIWMNTEILAQKMESFGWELATVSKKHRFGGTCFRVMVFDPTYPDEMTDYVFSCKYLYHWTPEERLDSIFEYGIEPRSENRFLSYKPKVHLIKEEITKKDASILGWGLYNVRATAVNGKYCLLRVSVDKILENSKFYGDTRFELGITTRHLIPKESIDLFGKIEYSNKDRYFNEILTVIADNDTMKD